MLIQSIGYAVDVLVWFYLSNVHHNCLIQVQYLRNSRALFCFIKSSTTVLLLIRGLICLRKEHWKDINLDDSLSIQFWCLCRNKRIGIRGQWIHTNETPHYVGTWFVWFRYISGVDYFYGVPESPTKDGASVYVAFGYQRPTALKCVASNC